MGILLGEHPFDGPEALFEIGPIEARLEAPLGPPAPALIRGDVGRHATIEDRLAVARTVVDAIQHCYTGALELALAGDIILASSSARFADTHARWGLTPVWGLSQRLPRRVGVAVAREMMFTCRTLSGGEAARAGLVNHCFEDGRFDDEVEHFARSVLENSWFSLAANKRLLIDTDGMTLSAGLAHETYRSEGTAPDMADRIARFSSRKTQGR